MPLRVLSAATPAPHMAKGYVDPNFPNPGKACIAALCHGQQS